MSTREKLFATISGGPSSFNESYFTSRTLWCFRASTAACPAPNSSLIVDTAASNDDWRLTVEGLPRGREVVRGSWGQLGGWSYLTLPRPEVASGAKNCRMSDEVTPLDAAADAPPWGAERSCAHSCTFPGVADRRNEGRPCSRGVEVTGCKCRL